MWLLIDTEMPTILICHLHVFMCITCWNSFVIEDSGCSVKIELVLCLPLHQFDCPLKPQAMSVVLSTVWCESEQVELCIYRYSLTRCFVFPREALACLCPTDHCYMSSWDLWEHISQQAWNPCPWWLNPSTREPLKGAVETTKLDRMYTFDTHVCVLHNLYTWKI